MDYFDVIILVVVTFIFLTDRKIKNKEEILNKDSSNIDKLKYVKENLKIINTKNLTIEQIKNEISKSDNQYLILKNNLVEVNDLVLDTVLLNYINTKETICGFNMEYENKKRDEKNKNDNLLQKIKHILRGIYIDGINYLNIFNRKELLTYGVVVLKKDDNNKLEYSERKIICKNIISYISSNDFSIKVKIDGLRKKERNIYISTILKSDIKVIIKILLLIISGSIITTNVIYNLLNIGDNVNSLIVSIVIYGCYSYIIGYIYKPIKKEKMIASYIFPIYFVIYIGITIYSFLNRVINKVQVS